jgi:hypothetical protein
MPVVSRNPLMRKVNVPVSSGRHPRLLWTFDLRPDVTAVSLCDSLLTVNSFACRLIPSFEQGFSASTQVEAVVRQLLLATQLIVLCNATDVCRLLASAWAGRGPTPYKKWWWPFANLS